MSGTATSLAHTVSDLTNGTNYTYKVRAVNATGTGAASDASTATSPGAPTLAGSSVEAATATLAIGSYGGDWYYKHTVPSDGTCSAKVAAGTASASLASLSSNTSYTYKAYSDSGCTDTNLLATAAAFLTKPGKPATLTVGRAGSAKLRLAASVTGDGSISKWQYQQKTTGEFGDWQDITSATTTSLSHIVGSLTNDTSYQFKVRAVNATGGRGDFGRLHRHVAGGAEPGREFGGGGDGDADDQQLRAGLA